MYSQTQTDRLMWICLILTIVPGTVLGQNWTGTYTWSGRCNTTVCCCGSGNMTVTSNSSNIYFSTGASSLCSGNTSSWLISNPYSYTYSQSAAGQTVVYTLSGDSKTINATNQAANQCSDIATKISDSNSVTPHGYWTLFLALIIVIATTIPEIG